MMVVICSAFPATNPSDVYIVVAALRAIKLDVIG